LTYRPIFFGEITSLAYYGNGGFNYWDVYHMPIWLRRFNIRKINEFVKKENYEIEKAQKGDSSPSSEVFRPNTKPDKSSYTFKK
jgi:hypothetical protein